MASLGSKLVKLYVPVAEVVVVRLTALPLVSLPVRVSVTPLMPDSPACWTPSLFTSTNTAPLMVAAATTWVVLVMNWVSGVAVTFLSMKEVAVMRVLSVGPAPAFGVTRKMKLAV